MGKERIIAGLLIAAGLINFAPVIGVFSGARIEAMYGVELDQPALEILLRHRAVLFGLVGGFMIYAAFRQALHLIAIIGGLVSMAAFLALYYSSAEQPPALLSIVYADIVGVVLLGVALTLYFIGEKR